MTSTPAYDLAGIGIGPFNLSLAALLAPVREVRPRFFEARGGFSWHSGLMFDFATLQSPPHKDLVTLADPTSPYSFLNYLAREHRLYRFIISDFRNVPRWEFERYCRWVCTRLDTLQFGTPIERVAFDGRWFRLESGRGRYRARSLALGIGREPNVPDEASPHLGDAVFHGAEYLHRRFTRRDKSILIVGGGQTGAEIFYDLITGGEPPGRVTWVTRRHNFVPFDESPFANELYVPGYAKVFYRQPAWHRERLLEKQKYSSDAILQPLLEEIYRRLYELDHRSSRRIDYRLLVDRRLTTMARDGAGYRVVTEGVEAGESTYADVVILATGFRYRIPPMLEPILDRIELDAHGYFALNEDFSLRWDGPAGSRIYAHNAGLHSHGWIDPNFAGMAWRSAVIINSLTGREVYDLGDVSTVVDWAGDAAGPAADGEAAGRLPGPGGRAASG